MTYEEAIETIKIAKAEVEWNYQLDYQIAFDMAIEALNKQIPKKPIYCGDGYADGKEVNDMAECPTCDNDDFEEGINNWGCNYCPECGQALDWSDEEDD